MCLNQVNILWYIYGETISRGSNYIIFELFYISNIQNSFQL